MTVKDILEKNRTSFSFEFFPPKTEKASAALMRSIEELTPLEPSYVSVTYGAGGTTRELTHELVLNIKKKTDLTVVPHLTCVGSTKEEVYSIVKKYRDNGIENILALRGDPPKGLESIQMIEDGFDHADELVRFIRENFPDICIGVAGFPEGHPQTPNRLLEIDLLKKKVGAGADYICTQLFFDNHEFYDYCDRCRLAGIDVPVIAGIMPITTKKGMNRMAELSPGTRFPANLLRAVGRVEDDDEKIQHVGIHWATNQVFDLLDHDVKGIHFYTLNKSKATVQVYNSLGIDNFKTFSG